MSVLPAVPPAPDPAPHGIPSLPDCDLGLAACRPGRLCPCGRRTVLPAAGEVA
jgi:hypothetical protein